MYLTCTCPVCVFVVMCVWCTVHVQLCGGKVLPNLVYREGEKWLFYRGEGKALIVLH